MRGGKREKAGRKYTLKKQEKKLRAYLKKLNEVIRTDIRQDKDDSDQP